MNLPDQFRLFAAEARKGLSPLYERLALGIAEDPELMALTEERKPGQPAPNLLFAAVHQELLTGADHALRAYYPSCGGTKRISEGEPFAHFRDFALHRAPKIASVVAGRVTNTNEVARSAILYPAYDFVARATGKPIQVLEIGPSAGLNLNWFRYGYQYTDEAGKVMIEREAGRELVLKSILKGEKRLPLAAQLPAVLRIRGLELNPISIADPAERLWQKALIWPERLDRLARLEPALAIAARFPPEIVAGNAASGLGQALADYDPTVPVVVSHTAVTYQFSRSMLQSFEAELAAAARTFHLFEAGFEWTGEFHELELTEHRGDPPARLRQMLGRADPHGTWIEWY